MTHIIKVAVSPRRRENLIKLADYLESLPNNYSHFEMETFISHQGECDLGDALDESIVKAIDKYENGCQWHIERRQLQTIYVNSISNALNNCGTVACAVGHGPAAGIPLAKSDIIKGTRGGITFVAEINFDNYSKNFIADTLSDAWEFLFSGGWSGVDNHHWGAAARIRFLLDKGGVPAFDENLDEMLEYEECVEVYRPYRIDQRQVSPAA